MNMVKKKTKLMRYKMNMVKKKKKKKKKKKRAKLMRYIKGIW